MNRKLGLFAVGALMLATAACNDGGSVADNAQLSGSLLSSFDYTPTGFSSTQNSFMGADSTWGAHGEDHHRGRGMGMGMGMGMGVGLGGLMGGGLHDLFRGVGFGPGGGRGEHCESETHGNLTVSCTQTYTSDSTSVTTTITVKGTITRRDSSVTTVNNASTRTISGLKGTARTVNGTSVGNEQTAGKDTAGTFTVKRVMGDTIKAVVIPVPTTNQGPPPFPTAGTVIRASSITVTRASGTTSSTRREVVTYDGSSTAKVTITQDGTTKSCTVALPHGKLQCS